MMVLGGEDGLISFNDNTVDRATLEALMIDCDEN
jgi:hypothetical protein